MPITVTLGQADTKRKEPLALRPTCRTMTRSGLGLPCMAGEEARRYGIQYKFSGQGCGIGRRAEEKIEEKIRPG